VGLITFCLLLEALCKTIPQQVSQEVDNTGTVFIRWDSLTLNQMGLDLAIRCEEENIDWEVMTLGIREV